MTEHFNQLTEAEQERLSILIEECGEVTKAAAKIQRHGYESVNPDLMASLTNREDLAREVGHVVHAINRMSFEGDLSELQIGRSCAEKAFKIKQYLHHQTERAAGGKP